MGILTNTAATPEVPEAPVAPTAAELAVLALRQMVINFFYNYNGETFQLSTKLGYQILGDKTARELVKNLTGLKVILDAGGIKPKQVIPIFMEVDYLNEATAPVFDAKELGGVVTEAVTAAPTANPFD